jgi:transposase
VYVDESGVINCLQRENGRAPRGVTVEGVKPGKKTERMNVIGALCNGIYLGVTCYRHSTTGEFFERWFEEVLLKVIPEGYTVIMDNAGFHRKGRLRELAKKAKVNVEFLPAYSPDYNPIEKSWANMKRYLRDNLHDFLSLELAVDYYFFRSNF